jgi:hypothetical protein
MRVVYIIGMATILAPALIGCKHALVRQMPANQPIISVEERSRMFRVISQSSGKLFDPGVDIFADGRCMVRTIDGKEYERRLRLSEVRSLLGFFEGQGFFVLSTEVIELAIDRDLEQRLLHVELPDGSIVVTKRSRVCGVDGSDTRIVARTPSRTVDISRYLLSCELEEYQTVNELKIVQRCIEKVYKVAGL